MKTKLPLIIALYFIIALSAGLSLIAQSSARAQVEEQQPKDEAKDEPQAVAAQAVIAVVCKPEQLVEEIHRLNKQGQAVSEEDVRVVGDKLLIFILVGTDSTDGR